VFFFSQRERDVSQRERERERERRKCVSQREREREREKDRILTVGLGLFDTAAPVTDLDSLCSLKGTLSIIVRLIINWLA
jgi:hypothetical protein